MPRALRLLGSVSLMANRLSLSLSNSSYLPSSLILNAFKTYSSSESPLYMSRAMKIGLVEVGSSFAPIIYQLPSPIRALPLLSSPISLSRYALLAPWVASKCSVPLLKTYPSLPHLWSWTAEPTNAANPLTYASLSLAAPDSTSTAYYVGAPSVEWLSMGRAIAIVWGDTSMVTSSSVFTSKMRGHMFSSIHWILMEIPLHIISM